MAYYLSKKNKLIVELLVPKLKEATNEIKIETADPKNLEYIIRNAGNTTEYSWIKDKFTLRVKEGYLLCKLRNPNFKISISGESTDIEFLTFQETFNKLFNLKPLKLIIKNSLEESDIIKLELWCSKHSYSMEKNEETITFIKS